MESRVIYLGALLSISLLASQTRAQSIGYWHLPSTQPQFCGLGYGPGHHAPMIRAHGCQPLRIARYELMRGCPDCIAPQAVWFCKTGFQGRQSHSQLDTLLKDSRPDRALFPNREYLERPIEGPESILPTPKNEESPASRD